MSLSHSSTSRPGAMSLLDKYAAINASIEDARKRVASTRADIESINSEIENIREERDRMIGETQSKKEQKLRLENHLKEASMERITKLKEKMRIEKEFITVKRELSETRRRIDEERIKFLERGREFRASCKRMRVAASILVLDQQLNSNDRTIDNNEKFTEIDLWRRLQHEEEVVSDEDIDDEDIDLNNTGQRKKLSNKGCFKEHDPEIESAENEEKRSRQALIEVECELHAMRTKHDDAVHKSNDRNHKLTQQRAQLARHRKEMEQMEKELELVKNDTTEVNQSAIALERECTRRKQSSNTSNGNHLHSSHQHNCYSNPQSNSSMYGCTSHHTELNSHNKMGGHSFLHKTNGPISNPYKTNGSRNGNPNQQNNLPVRHTFQGSPFPRSRQNVRSSPRHQYGSKKVDSLTTPQNTNRDENMRATQHPHHGGRMRNQRKFGTTVSLNSDLNVSGINHRDRNDSAASCALHDSRNMCSPLSVAKGGSDIRGDDGSDNSSSSSSSDDDIISFEVFGKKRVI